MLINRRIFRYARLSFGACLLILVLNFLPFVLQRPQSFIHRKVIAEDFGRCLNSIYIASVQYNFDVMLKTHWILSLLQLVKKLQTAKLTIYLLIYKSGSKNNIKKILLKTLDINHIVHLDNKTHAAAIEKFLSSTSTSG